MSEPGESTIDAQLAQSILDIAEERLHSEHLQKALMSSRRIGMAMGIVIERYKLGDDKAFDVLRRLSMELNRKLVDVADDIIRTGEVPRSTQVQQPDSDRRRP